MRKKAVLGSLVILALVLTTGSFAYTYTNTSGATLDAYLADASIATYEVADNQPNWASLLPRDQLSMEALYPNAPGDETGLSFQSPDTGEHWDKVDDVIPDDEETFVATFPAPQWQRDLYNLTNVSAASGVETITGITVFFRFGAGFDGKAFARAAIKTNDQVFEGPMEISDYPERITASYRWEDNPATGKAWTFAEIAALQAGITLKGQGKYHPAGCTQVYVVVEYEWVIIQGEVPGGNLYGVTPHPAYTGDLLVKIYLTNTSELIRAYQYLNIKIYVPGSLEVTKTPHYQILSLENGVVLFNIEGGSAAKYDIIVTGGSYRLVSADTEDWGAGWSITPEFYCEVTQK